jgi:peptidoglycan/xylan/chitin deacetylase (PgdA/CDA1 family)
METHRATYCDYRRFATQMGWLKLAGYTVLSMTEVLQCVKGEKPIPPRAVAITFDDAYENFYEYALPILKRMTSRQPCMRSPACSDRIASWLSTDGHATPPLMTGARLRELMPSRIEIGSHSVSHIRLAGQTAEVVQQQVANSKAELEAVLGTRVDHFCYPYGSHDIHTVEAVAAAGYLTATTCERAPATTNDDPLSLPRKAVAWGDSLVGVLWKMHMKNEPKRPLIRRSEIVG